MLRKALSLKRFPYKSGCACSEKWGRPSTFALLFTRLGGHAPKSWTAAGLARAFFIRFYRFLGGYTPKKHWIFSRETGWSCSEFCTQWAERYQPTSFRQSADVIMTEAKLPKQPPGKTFVISAHAAMPNDLPYGQSGTGRLTLSVSLRPPNLRPFQTRSIIQ